MVNRHNNQNNYNRRNTAILNVNQPKNKRKTLKLNNNNNYGPRIPTMRGPDEFKMAFPPTHIRDWTYETQRSLDPANINLGWMGANGIKDAGAAKAVARSLTPSANPATNTPVALLKAA